VNVVHIHHPRQRQQGGAHQFRLDVHGDAVEQHHQRIADQHDPRVAHRHTHADRRERIEPWPTGEPHQQGADQHRQGYQRIGHQVDHRSPAVEIVLADAAVAEEAG